MWGPGHRRPELWEEEPLVYLLCTHLHYLHLGDLSGSFQPRLLSKLRSPPHESLCVSQGQIRRKLFFFSPESPGRRREAEGSLM